VRTRLTELARKYDHFAEYMAVLPAIEGPVDLEGFLEALPPDVIAAAGAAARKLLVPEASPVTPRKRS
jgi:hypothetical protein